MDLYTRREWENFSGSNSGGRLQKHEVLRGDELKSGV